MARESTKGAAAKRNKAKRQSARGGKPPGGWLFAYGSLVWDGARGCEERRLARLFGYHRSLCIYSHVYRGTAGRPGLVLGLARGGSCRGLALRIPEHRAGAWLARIRARENVTGVYREKIVRLRLAAKPGGKPRTVTALAFVADPHHRQYAGKLPRAEILRCLRQGRGTKGCAADYLRETVKRLRALSVRDRALERLLAAGI